MSNQDDKSSRKITGYAILFNTPSAPLAADDTGEIREVIAPSAITRNLLDNSDIKMTMFHDRQLILARSNKGSGTLKYSIDAKGVKFEFDAPNTADGDKALELVRRGDIAGCSFAFSTYYNNTDYVKRTTATRNGKTIVTYTVNKITGIYDFTLASDPAYPATSCQARERQQTQNQQHRDTNKRQARTQIKDMRQAAKMDINF